MSATPMTPVSSSLSSVAAPGPFQRFESIDMVRGLIMILMAIDHASFFIGRWTHVGGEFWQGDFPTYTDPSLFFTRYISHLCAPGFIFLMGMGMSFFYHKRLTMGWQERDCLQYYLKRALVIFSLQFLYENFCWQIGLKFSPFPIYFGILSLFGLLMLIASFCIRFSSWNLLLLALLAEGGTVALTLLVSQTDGGLTGPLSLVGLLFMPAQNQHINVLYPIVPWVPSVLMGMIAGRLFLKDSKKFLQKLPWVGWALLILALALRLFAGEYGNLRIIELTDVLSLFYGTKYPPSLFYLLWTTGILLLLISLFSRLSLQSGFLAQKLHLPLLLKPFSILGKSALFFYVVHLPLYALLGLPNVQEGGPLIEVFVGWGVGLVILIPLTWIFIQYKNTLPQDSLLRMF